VGAGGLGGEEGAGGGLAGLSQVRPVRGGGRIGRSCECMVGGGGHLRLGVAVVSRCISEGRRLGGGELGLGKPGSGWLRRR